MKNHLNEKIEIAGGYRIGFLHIVHPYEKSGWLRNYSSAYISKEQKNITYSFTFSYRLNFTRC